MDADNQKDKHQPYISPSLSTKILVGLLIGIGCGIFFGEYCAPLKVVGDAFVGLLRMTVLPFIIVSLIANLGRLPLLQSKRLIMRGGVVLLILWAIGLTVIYCLTLSFPEWKSGSFYSASVIDQPDQAHFLDFFIPSNIFYSLYENHIPAVVVFCLFLGLSLTGIKNRDALIIPLDILSSLLIRVSASIARLAPYGVFAIAASSAGTISLNELERLQAYLLSYTAGCLLISFFILPLIVSAFTPFKYLDILKTGQGAMITAFATGKLIIVLPLLIEETTQLFEKYNDGEIEDVEATVDVLYPLAYPFPHLGKLLGILFIPFASWFLGTPLGFEEYPQLLSTGLFSYFGGPVLAIPFLLEQSHLPNDMFQMFLLSGVYCERFGDATGVMHLLSFTILTTCAVSGKIECKIIPLIRSLSISVVLLVTILVCSHYYLENTLDLTQSRDAHIRRMQLIFNPVESTVLETATANPDTLLPNESVLERVRRRRTLRVGFNADSLPFAFFNSNKSLVGYDIEVAHALARDLGVKLEFVPFEPNTMITQINDDHFDVVMSGLIATVERSEAVTHTDPYMSLTLALMVEDYRAREFRSTDDLFSHDKIRIGFVDLSSGFITRLKTLMPNAELIQLRTSQQYFENPSLADALLISAESGSAYSIIYPNFEVVVPTGRRVSLPLYYAIAHRDNEMKEFLENWVTLRQDDGSLSDKYDHWILGKDQTVTLKRWSVIRDVLHWVE